MLLDCCKYDLVRNDLAIFSFSFKNLRSLGNVMGLILR